MRSVWRLSFVYTAAAMYMVALPAMQGAAIPEETPRARASAHRGEVSITQVSTDRASFGTASNPRGVRAVLGITSSSSPPVTNGRGLRVVLGSGAAAVEIRQQPDPAPTGWVVR